MLLIGVVKILKAFSEFLMGYGASCPKDSYASYQATVLLIRSSGCLPRLLEKFLFKGPKLRPYTGIVMS